jgi:hypothetical protein
MEIHGCEIGVVGRVMHDLGAVSLYAVGSPVVLLCKIMMPWNSKPKSFVRSGLPQPVKYTTVNIQQLQCHHIQGNLEDAQLYGPKKGSCHDLPC